MASRKLRVAMVTPRFFPFSGGVETHVYEVARRLAADVDLTVLTADPTGKLPPSDSFAGVRVERVRAWPEGRDYYYAPGIARAVTRGDWDLIHCQGYHTLVPPMAMLAARRAGLPYVVTFHSGGHSSRLRNAARTMQRRVLRPLLVRARRLIAVSRFEADLFSRDLRLPLSRFAVVPNGAQLPATNCVPDLAATAPLILSVGRLERYKGHQRILAALPAIQQRRPDARLRIVGSGPYEGELRRMARDLDVVDSVEIGAIAPGERGAMAAAMQEAALVTLFSEYEAHPVAVMEALSMRRPVLVADAAGLHELAEQGLVRAVAPDSSHAQIASAVLAELENPLRPQQIVLPTWERCAAEILAIYRGATTTENRCEY